MTRRRWLVAGGGLAALVVLLAAVGWWVAVPQWRPGLRAGESYAVDVSAHQGRVDWAAVARDHVDVALIKSTEGSDLTDADFARNRDGALAAGLRVTAYHFFGLCSPGVTQAQNMLRASGTVTSTAVDLELAGNCAARPDPAAVEAQLRAFLGAVEGATGRPVLVYAGADFTSRYPFVRALGRPTWVRHLYRRPGGGWTVWQASDRAEVHGIRGHVDLDVLRA